MDETEMLVFWAISSITRGGSNPIFLNETNLEKKIKFDYVETWIDYENPNQTHQFFRNPIR